jgi:hypothetical protein
MMKRTAVLALTGIALAATTAVAYTIDDAGFGWVGKGEVQTVFGLNNARMQAAHTRVVFDYEATTVYSWQCEWYTGADHNLSHHTHPQTTSRAVSAAIGSGSRPTGQWTGWNLTGFEGATATGGDFTATCPGNDAGNGNSGEKTVVDGSVTSTTTGGLFASIDGDRRLLP